MFIEVIDEIKNEIEQYPLSELSKESLRLCTRELFLSKVKSKLPNCPPLTRHEFHEQLEYCTKHLNGYIDQLDRYEKLIIGV